MAPARTQSSAFDLHRLALMRASGALSPAEYTAATRRLLGTLPGDGTPAIDVVGWCIVCPREGPVTPLDHYLARADQIPDSARVVSGPFHDGARAARYLDEWRDDYRRGERARTSATAPAPVTRRSPWPWIAWAIVVIVALVLPWAAYNIAVEQSRDHCLAGAVHGDEIAACYQHAANRYFLWPSALRSNYGDFGPDGP
jgi:hypothetical protein